MPCILHSICCEIVQEPYEALIYVDVHCKRSPYASPSSRRKCAVVCCFLYNTAIVLKFMKVMSLKFKYSCLFLLIIVVFPLAAQHFKPYSILRVLRTEHFEIIYSADSEKTARKLAERADALYDKVSTLTGITLGHMVPVVITPETDEHNGYMNPLPYPHIVLFDTPASIEWTIFSNSLESLFLHEMTHAVTGSTRGNLEEVFYRVFGGWVYPAGITAPWFMIEGASVSFESLDGTGRANDPLIKQKLRQDILENSFKTPFQAEGVWDMPPYGNVYYYYGGLFSAYLQKKYGMEKYGELWREMGRRFHISLIFYNSGFYNIFKSVYGVSLIDCWNDFKASLALSGVEENTSDIIYDGKTIIKDVAAAGGKIFFIDNFAGKIMSYDTAEKKLKTVVSVDLAAYALDISEDGSRILVSTYQRFGANTGQFSRAIAIEYSASSGFRTGREWKGLYNARYFRDGVAALNSDTHISNLVYRAGNDRNGKNEETLLRGSETLLFSNPSPINNDWIAFTSAKSGIRELSIFNYKTRAVYSLHGSFENDVDVWRYMRGLRFSEGRLYFSYNNDDRMYKLAFVSINNLPEQADDGAALIANDGFSAEVYLSEKDFSGGVLYPVSSGNVIYYGASFSIWNKILTFPESVTELEHEGTALSAIPWNSERIIPEESYNKIDTERTYTAKLYNPLKYFNPLNLWMPFPYVTPITSSIFNDGTSAFAAAGNFQNLRVDGVGIFSYISDPMDQNLIFLGAGYDFRCNIVPLDISWTTFSFMLPLMADFSDVVIKSDDFIEPLRETKISVQASYRIPLGNERLSLSVLGLFAVYWYFYDDSGSEDSAYTWPLMQENYYVTGGIRFSNLSLYTWERFGRGFFEQLYIRSLLFDEYDFPRFENIFKMSIESIHGLRNIPVVRNFAFQNVLYGVYDDLGVNYLGHSRRYRSSVFDQFAVSEYAADTYSYIYQWLIGGEFEFSPVSFEIQKNLSHLYFNRIFAGIGYRWVYMDDNSVISSMWNPAADEPLFHSVVFRLSGVVSILPLTVLPVKATFSMLAVLKLSSLYNDFSYDDWYFGWGVSVTY
jgi:hypothetical protein